LAEVAGLNLSLDHTDTLAEMNEFALEGRYPDSLATPPTMDEAKHYLSKAREVLKCLTTL
jgi:HEPN domain-containing protein